MEPTYSQSPRLNDKSYDLPDSDWRPIGPPFTVTKQRSGTPIELEFSGEVSAGSINAGNGVLFEIRLDSEDPDFVSRGSLKTGSLHDDVSTRSIYTDLKYGTYRCHIWAQAPNPGSSADGIVLDPGGWGERILATEF